MDVIILNPTTFTPMRLCEGYSSLIWTERFFDFGEFMLKTPLVSETVQKLPVGSLISLVDTAEVMIVETYSIESDTENGEPELTVSGRSLDSFLENRVITETVYGETWKVQQKYTPSEIVSIMIWNALINSSGEDPMRPWLPGLNQDVHLAVENLAISLSISSVRTEQDWYFQSGVVSELVKNIQKQHSIGLQTIRPNFHTEVGSSNAYSKIFFDVSRTEQRGVMSNALVDDNAMRLDVYQGTDRTINQSSVDPVIFQGLSGHLLNQKYVVSGKLEKHYARISTSEGVLIVANRLHSNNVGLQRKVMFIDGGSKDENVFDVWAKGVITKARAELNNNAYITMSEGEMSPNSPYLYKKDYFLGDTITFSGTYDIDMSMFVSEVVRTNDENGTTLTPGLILV